MEDELMDFSGNFPDEIQRTIQETLLSNEELMNATSSTIMVEVMPATTTIVPYLEYSPNFYRIGMLSLRCLLSLLILVLSGTIKRDFLKIFVLLIIVPIVFDCGFDIYTEIKTSISIYDKEEVVRFITNTFTYLESMRQHSRAGTLQNGAIAIYREELTRHTGYNIFNNEPLFAIVSYILADVLFWSTLFTSVVAFFYAHKAIVRPEEINYIPYIWTFLKVQLFPILFTLIDTLMASFEVPQYVAIGAASIIRLAACLVAFTLATQVLASLLVFCRRRDDYTKSSPYDQVRDGKWRLFSFIIFQLVIHVLTVPYLIWAGITLAQDFLYVFNFSAADQQRLPIRLAVRMFEDHHAAFLIRPLVILVAILVFIAPYRKRFVRFFCSCCRRN
ncbi:hypothetical protein Q1695_005620 [Nippostrongylus brasiliensis]|nr:hypothetical protein Q1695_005620 [Nippostrongylus brasiliensis]